MFMFTILSPFHAKPHAQAAVKEGFVAVEGGNVWYRIVGADKKGIPLLIVHGGPGAPHDYLESLEALSGERPVVFYDQLGCGNSDRPEDTSLWTVERFVAELEQVRIALKLDMVHILGQSWGTMLSVEYLLRKNPSGVKSLILSAPFLSTPIWAEDQRKLITQLDPEIQKTMFDCEQTGDYESVAYQNAMMVFYEKHLCRINPWPDCIQRTFEKMGVAVYNYMWGPSEFTTTGTLANADVTNELSKIEVPTLFTCGEFDEATPVSTLLFQRMLPGSEIKIFQDASHQHHIEQKDVYNSLVREFIARND